MKVATKQVVMATMKNLQLIIKAMRTRTYGNVDIHFMQTFKTHNYEKINQSMTTNDSYIKQDY
jgi:hypothetical protein